MDDTASVPPTIALLAIVLGAVPTYGASARTPLERFAKNRSAGATWVDGEVLLRGQTPQSGLRIKSHAAVMGCRLDRQFGRRALFLVRCDPNVSMGALIEAWQDAPEVTWAEPSYHEAYDALPDDVPVEAWHLNNVGQEIDDVTGVAGADISAAEGWDIVTAASDIVVAVIDTGVYAEHDELTGAIWRNAGEICDNGMDDDNNGYVDDCHGWDVGDDDSDPDPTNLPTTRPSGGSCSRHHGTFIAGLIGARGNNGAGTAGVAWRVQIMPLKKHDDAECDGGTARSIEAIAYAIDNGAHVLNLSFSGTAYSEMFEEVLQDADARGIITVMSAGNDAEDVDTARRYPNNYRIDHGLIVANTTNRDRLSSSSNWGAMMVDLAAPGNDVYSTDIDHILDFSSRSGTSYSAPIVAGAVALVMARYPELTAVRVKRAVRDGVDLLDALDCTQVETCVASGGRLNLRKALDRADELAPKGLEIRANTVWDGERRVELAYSLLNSGRGRIRDLVAELLIEPESPELTVEQGRVALGDLVAGETRRSGAMPLSVLVNEACNVDFGTTLVLRLTDELGNTWRQEEPLDVMCDLDLDRDGARRSVDCDDGDRQIHPGHVELCDGKDNDCDGVIDPADSFDARVWYGDADGDGLGDVDDTRRACEAPAGYVARAAPRTTPMTPPAPMAEVSEEVVEDAGCGCRAGAGSPAGLLWFMLLAMSAFVVGRK